MDAPEGCCLEPQSATGLVVRDESRPEEHDWVQVVVLFDFLFKEFYWD